MCHYAYELHSEEVEYILIDLRKNQSLYLKEIIGHLLWYIFHVSVSLQTKLKI